MLSRPPASLAAATSGAAASSSAPPSAGARTLVLGTIDVRPSEQTGRGPRRGAVTVVMSTCTLGSGPSARVMTDRCGWCSACSSVSLPRATQLADERVVAGERLSAPSRNR